MEFMKKDMPCSDDQYVHVETEETKPSNSQKGQLSHIEPHEEFCDLLFDMTVAIKLVQKKGTNDP
jgi:hypothetical protein